MDILAGSMLGLPVMTLDGGATIAKVQDMIVDPTRRQVLAVLVKDRAFLSSPRAIPFGRLAANGPDAVLVANSKVGLDVDRDPVLKALDNNQKVLGSTVISDDGRKVGTVKDMFIDSHTGEIKSYQVVVSLDSATYSLQSDGVVSLGKDAMYVTAATADKLFSQAEAARAAPITTSVPDQIDSADVSLSKDASNLVAPNIVTSNVSSILGGTTVNMRLLAGIGILVLGILVLVYPSLLPLIAGISLIVIGLWIALQNASAGGKV